MNKIYYISQGATPQEHIQNIEKVCRGGVSLIQLRMKGYSDEIHTETAVSVADMVHQYKGTIIINDNIDVALQSNADGVHLGQNDVSPIVARKKLKDKIIGGTANTAAQCKKLIEEGVDYLGVGPYRFTSTKENLSPLLGIEGYQKIIDELTDSNTIPIYAIGGIREEDIKPLLALGIKGVAISGLLTKMSKSSIQQFMTKKIN